MKKNANIKTMVKERMLRYLTAFMFFFAFSAVPSFISLPLPQPLSAVAEVPIKFTYQGNIRQNGFLVRGERDIVFRIYSSSYSATSLWTSPVNTVNVSTGVFKVDLEPYISDWEDGNLWLELEIEGTVLSPREEVTSSPYAVNSLLHSGKKYITSATSPAGDNLGDLWMDSNANALKFWDGSAWTLTSGAAIPGAHASMHESGGSDPITSLGTHTVTGPISFDNGASLEAGAGASAIFISTDLVISGALNSSSNLSIGGAGYSVAFASSVSAGWFYGNGSGIESINASNISLGLLSADRISDSSITRFKFNQSGCSNGQLFKWNGSLSEWTCSDDAIGAGGGELDPLSIHIQDTLQANATFYISSGTVNYFTVNNNLDVFGTARIKGGPSSDGLFVNSSGNVGIGALNPLAKLEVLGNDLQPYSLAVGTSSVYDLVVSTSGNIGVGEINPQARMEVTGDENPGEYIMIFNSGTKMAAWLRNK